MTNLSDLGMKLHEEDYQVALHQESVVLVSCFFAFSCILKFYKMQKLKTQFFFSRTSKNNNYVFSIYTRYQGLLLHICSDLVSN